MQKGVDEQGVGRASAPLSGMQPEEQSQRAHTSFNIPTILAGPDLAPSLSSLCVCARVPRSKDRGEKKWGSPELVRPVSVWKKLRGRQSWAKGGEFPHRQHQHCWAPAPLKASPPTAGSVTYQLSSWIIYQHSWAVWLPSGFLPSLWDHLKARK